MAPRIRLSFEKEIFEMESQLAKLEADPHGQPENTDRWRGSRTPGMRQSIP